MIASALFFFLSLFSPPAGAEPMVLLPSGKYLSFILKSATKKGEAPVFRVEPTAVKSFYLDRRVVTNGDFLLFVKANPQWRKSKIPALFADEHYLSSWPSDQDIGGSKNKAVTDVSWFAAKAYCGWLGKTLPTTDQWEYALNDQGRSSARVKEKILAWYGRPKDFAVADAGRGAPNGFGIHDLVGLVWEWTLDFNSFLTGEELRGDGGKDDALFCGGASLGKLSADDYPAYMRYSFRASLKAKYTTHNLGFRCAREKK